MNNTFIARVVVTRGWKLSICDNQLLVLSSLLYMHRSHRLDFNDTMPLKMIRDSGMSPFTVSPAPSKWLLGIVLTTFSFRTETLVRIRYRRVTLMRIYRLVITSNPYVWLFQLFLETGHPVLARQAVFLVKYIFPRHWYGWGNFSRFMCSIIRWKNMPFGYQMDFCASPGVELIVIEKLTSSPFQRH